MNPLILVYRGKQGGNISFFLSPVLIILNHAVDCSQVVSNMPEESSRSMDGVTEHVFVPWLLAISQEATRAIQGHPAPPSGRDAPHVFLSAGLCHWRFLSDPPGRKITSSNGSLCPAGKGRAWKRHAG